MNHSLTRFVLASALILNTASAWAAASSSVKVTVTMTLTDLAPGDSTPAALTFHGFPTTDTLYGSVSGFPDAPNQSANFSTGLATLESTSGSASAGGSSIAASITASPSEFGPNELRSSGSIEAPIPGSSLVYQSYASLYRPGVYQPFTLSPNTSIAVLIDFELDATTALGNQSSLRAEWAQAGFSLFMLDAAVEFPDFATLISLAGEVIETADPTQAGAAQGPQTKSLHSSTNFIFENKSASPIEAKLMSMTYARGTASAVTAIPEPSGMALVLAGLFIVRMNTGRARPR